MFMWKVVRREFRGLYNDSALATVSFVRLAKKLPQHRLDVLARLHQRYASPPIESALSADAKPGPYAWHVLRDSQLPCRESYGRGVRDHRLDQESYVVQIHPENAVDHSSRRYR